MKSERKQWTRDLADEAREYLARAPNCCSEPGYVYILQSPAAPDIVKIGRAESDLVRRLKGLQASCPVRLRLVALGRGARYEKSFHGWFCDSRQHGEWFTASAVNRWLRKWHENHCLCCEYKWRPLGA